MKSAKVKMANPAARGRSLCILHFAFFNLTCRSYHALSLSNTCKQFTQRTRDLTTGCRGALGAFPLSVKKTDTHSSIVKVRCRIRSLCSRTGFLAACQLQPQYAADKKTTSRTSGRH